MGVCQGGCHGCMPGWWCVVRYLARSSLLALATLAVLAHRHVITQDLGGRGEGQGEGEGEGGGEGSLQPSWTACGVQGPGSRVQGFRPRPLRAGFRV